MTNWLDKFLGGKNEKEAQVSPQGENAIDHFEKKLESNAWVEGLMDLDEKQVEAEYKANLEAEARALGKTAAHEFKSDEEVFEADKERAVKILSDYALAEMLAELRCNKEQNTQEMFHEAKEKAKKEVASSREKAEKSLMDMIPENTHLDWKKAFERFSKEATPEQATEKDLFQPIAPDASHDFEKPTEEKFKVPSDEKKADVMIGVGREADERTEATKEAGVVQESITEGLGKVASITNVTASGNISLVKKADYQGWTNSQTWQVALWIDNEQSLNQAVMEMVPQYKEAYQLGDAIKAMVEEMQPDLGNTMWQDMLTWALSEVNWREIAESYMQKATEASKLPKVEKKADPMNPLKREELPVDKQGCPVCGSMGKDMANGQMDHMSCEGCGITYSSKKEATDSGMCPKRVDHHVGQKCETCGNDETNIKTHASKEEVLKIMKKAEVESPWKVITDENGQECIARVSQPTNTKESEENKDEEIQK